MKFSLTPVITISGLLAGISAAPAELQKRACTNPVLRKSWNVATSAEKTSYVNAVKCLATKPSVLGTNATLYDDFTYVYLSLAVSHAISSTKFGGAQLTDLHSVVHRDLDFRSKS